MDPNTGCNHLLKESFSETFNPSVFEIKAVESGEGKLQAELMFIELNQIVREIREHCGRLMAA